MFFDRTVQWIKESLFPKYIEFTVSAIYNEK